MPLRRMPAVVANALNPADVLTLTRDRSWVVIRNPEGAYTALSDEELRVLAGELAARGVTTLEPWMIGIWDPYRRLAQVPSSGELNSLFDEIETPRRRLVLGLPDGSYEVAFEATMGGAPEPAILLRPEAGSRVAPGAGERAAAPPPTRFLEASLPRRVHRTDDFVVRARIALGAGAISAAIEGLDVPAEGMDVLLLMEAPGFAMRSEARYLVHVPREGDSAWSLFELAPRDEGLHEVFVSAYHGAALLATLRLQVAVEDTGPTVAASTSRAPASTRRREAGEVTLLVRYDVDRRVYRYQWIDDTMSFTPERESGMLGSTPTQLVERLVANLNEMARTTTYDPENALWRLHGEGHLLWKQLIPATLADQISRGGIRALMIVADADPLPWELLWPNDGDPRFLCERFPVMRWVRDGAPATRLSLDRPRLIVSAEQLQYAQPEVDDVVRVLDRAGFAPQPQIDDLSQLRAALQAADFGILHFACHNAYAADSPASSTVTIGGQKFAPVFLSPLERHLAQRPLVFMNACRTAGQAVQYTAAAGWAQGFVAAGCGAFVGSLWEVRDGSARTFAASFYDALARHRPLGAAVAEARQAIASAPGDPTWLAYSVYGDPAAVI